MKRGERGPHKHPTNGAHTKREKPRAGGKEAHRDTLRWRHTADGVASLRNGRKGGRHTTRAGRSRREENFSRKHTRVYHRRNIPLPSRERARARSRQRDAHEGKRGWAPHSTRDDQKGREFMSVYCKGTHRDLDLPD